MNKSRYKEITMNLLPCLSVGCQTITRLWMLLMPQMVIAVLSIPLFRFTRDGKMYLFTVISSPLKKMETPIVLYSPTTNSSVYYVKKTENADLKSGDADIVNN